MINTKNKVYKKTMFKFILLVVLFSSNAINSQDLSTLKFKPIYQDNTGENVRIVFVKEIANTDKTDFRTVIKTCMFMPNHTFTTINIPFKSFCVDKKIDCLYGKVQNGLPYIIDIYKNEYVYKDQVLDMTTFDNLVYEDTCKMNTE
ncbi:MAG: hypothetical protein LC112_15335 [Flavobacteriales bacterium]|nr:hypothetical protein [Flavobacteriales bacterium]